MSKRRSPPKKTPTLTTDQQTEVRVAVHHLRRVAAAASDIQKAIDILAPMI